LFDRLTSIFKGILKAMHYLLFT